MMKNRYSVRNLYEEANEELGLELITGEQGLQRPVSFAGAERAGLGLAGFFKGRTKNNLLVFGKAEVLYLKELIAAERLSRLENILTQDTPAVFIADCLRPPQELVHECHKRNLPLIRTKKSLLDLICTLTTMLDEKLAPFLSCHGCFVDVFGLGMLIQGDAAVGKSDAALGLIERGHRFISDDVVKLRRTKNGKLEGSGVASDHYPMEVKGIGIVNIARLYGAVSVLEKKNLDIVVKLEVWNDSRFYDRTFSDEQTTSFLGIAVPCYKLPIKSGRDLVLLLETIALHYKQKILFGVKK